MLSSKNAIIIITAGSVNVCDMLHLKQFLKTFSLQKLHSSGASVTGIVSNIIYKLAHCSEMSHIMASENTELFFIRNTFLQLSSHRKKKSALLSPVTPCQMMQLLDFFTFLVDYLFQFYFGNLYCSQTAYPAITKNKFILHIFRCEFPAYLFSVYY